MTKGDRSLGTFEGTIETTEDYNPSGPPGGRSQTQPRQVRRVPRRKPILCRQRSPQTALSQRQTVSILACSPTRQQEQHNLERRVHPTGTEVRPMHRSLQFGMRENPAFDRRHGSRLPINDPVDTTSVAKAETDKRAPSRSPDQADGSAKGIPYTAQYHAATNGISWGWSSRFGKIWKKPTGGCIGRETYYTFMTLAPPPKNRKRKRRVSERKGRGSGAP